MTRFGFTLMTEQNGPLELVDAAVRAEDAGFDLLVSSDHYSPWLTEQGHAPYAWTVLGAVAHATSRVDLMTYVTCPTMRYHPAVVAQKAATLQILAEGRFTLGLGSGENLNEHVVGAGWPAVTMRQEMLTEAIEIIRELHTGELVNYRGEHFDVDSARIWDLPDAPVGIAVAVSGDEGVEQLAPLADHLIAVQPEKELVDGWNAVSDTRDRLRRPWRRADPDLLGPLGGRRRRAGPRAVPLVRRRLEGQRRPADPDGLLRRQPVRAPRGRRRVDPLRPRPRRRRRGGAPLVGGRLHRRRARAGGRRAPAGVPRQGGRAAAREAARGLRGVDPTRRVQATRRRPGHALGVLPALDLGVSARRGPPRRRGRAAA